MAVSPVTGQELIEQEDGTFKDPLTQDVFTQEYLDEVGDTNSTVERDPYADKGKDGRNYFGHPEGEDNVQSPASGTGPAGNPAPAEEEAPSESRARGSRKAAASDESEEDSE